jgi:hypothetical protein
MLLLLPAFAQTESLLSQSTDGLMRDPIDYAWEPARLGETTGSHVLGSLYPQSAQLSAGAIRPFGPGQLAVWGHGYGMGSSEFQQQTNAEGLTDGQLLGGTTTGGRLWLAWGNGRAGIALGVSGRYTGNTAVAEFYDVPTTGLAPYDDDTDTGLFTRVDFTQDVVVGFAFRDDKQVTEIDLLYRYDLSRPSVQASRTEGNERFETKGFWEPSTLLTNQMGHSGGVRLDSLVSTGSGPLRVLVEARVGGYRPAATGLIDILEVDGETVYRRDLELTDARLLQANARALVARHQELDRVEFRYGVSLGASTSAGAWKQATTLYIGDEQESSSAEFLGRWSSLTLGLPAAVFLPLTDTASVFAGANAELQTETEDVGFVVTGGAGEDTGSTRLQTSRTTVAGVRLEPNAAWTLDLATANLQSLSVSGVWHF